jgi:formylglycine-generating enzyme required for sulfatase activity/serine/threonine protein kinase
VPLTPGQVLNNRYRIVKLLGQGGFGAVYRAWDINFELACAVKENIDTSAEAQRQFGREARLLRTLRHPNLPLVTDYFTIPNQGQYLVMDYVEGEDLQHKLDLAGGPLPEAQALPWIAQVCAALIYLHNQNPPVIHRDIKPANIRITPPDNLYPQGKAMLVDFGIAKLYDPARRTTLGARAATPGYSPFEQYGQRPTDARTDIYALGATLYHLLTGQTPPEAADRVAGVAVIPPRQLNPVVSVQVSEAVMRALAMQPGDRWQSAAEFERAIFGVQPAITNIQVTVDSSVQSTVNNIRSTLNSWLGAGGSLQQPPGRDAPPAAGTHIPAVPAAPGPVVTAPPASVQQKLKTSNLKWAGALVGLAAVALILWALFGGSNVKVDHGATQTALAQGIERATQDALSTEGARPTRRPTAANTLEPTGTFTPLPPTVTPTETLAPTVTELPGRIMDEKGVEMVLILAGEFQMGSEGGRDNERPVHTVYLDAFYMDVYKVTNIRYAACVDDGGCEAPEYGYFGNVDYANHPVVGVDWNQAQAYCEWRGDELPTEAQWEKAARGGLEGKQYPWGDETPDCSRANFAGCKGDTSQVGIYPANGYGLFDMVGNVWEWVWDWHQADYYSSQITWLNPLGPSSGDSRVLRGGSWSNEPSFLRLAFRGYKSPSTRVDDGGFRCSRSR